MSDSDRMCYSLRTHLKSKSKTYRLFPMTDFPAARASMVNHQLHARGVRDERVLAAMGKVPREVFVPEEIASQAYQDCALPIDCGQTISQPIIVGMMTEALQLSGGEKVLEI